MKLIMECCNDICQSKSSVYKNTKRSMKRKTTPEKVLNVIGNRKLSVISGKIYLDDEVKDYPPDQFVEELEFLCESGYFTEMIDFKFDITTDEFEPGKNEKGLLATNVTPVLTLGMIRKALEKQGLYVNKLRNAYGNEVYHVVDENNILQSPEQGMYFNELAKYAELA